jgi:hypothetical protein
MRSPIPAALVADNSFHVGAELTASRRSCGTLAPVLVPQIAVIRSGVRDDISGIDYTVFVLHTRCWTGVLDVERSEKK